MGLRLQLRNDDGVTYELKKLIEGLSENGEDDSEDEIGSM